ncbi:MAG: DNA polymerase III subunit gamma/tau [Alphaproteobacteria bacterium]|nr:DNA polymerase III subunit gamma/tau [Alphaproteobacteria bacterium]
MSDTDQSKVLYRVYRPNTFSEVSGQSAVVQVLQSSVKNKKIAHAYLFSGPRGTGKTSIARIFARALEIDPIDIFEIDAASHTSIENIKEILHSIYTLPIQSKYKIYILDEVHMLSTKAFTALLKTLEEPPAYAVFVLATTEQDKIPDTIISRCVQFVFARPTEHDIAQVLVSVATKEKKSLDMDTANLIAKVADGSYRDALTALQKILYADTKKEITKEMVELILALPKRSLVFNYVGAIATHNITLGLETLDQIRAQQSSQRIFLLEVIDVLRSVFLIREGISIANYSSKELAIIKEYIKEKHINTVLFSALIYLTGSQYSGVDITMNMECILYEYGAKKNQ